MVELSISQVSKTCANEKLLEALNEELRKRDNFINFIGRSTLCCDKCGGHRKVLSQMMDRSTECELCFIERRVEELVQESRKPTLDVADFARL